MSLVIVATAFPVPEHRDEVIAAFVTAAEQVQAVDEGCELYALHEGPDRLVMVEKWASQEAIDKHGKSPALAALSAALTGKIVGSLDVQVLTPHPAGTPQQGTL
jgi:quinol monooxygenase YgiN